MDSKMIFIVGVPPDMPLIKEMIALSHQYEKDRIIVIPKDAEVTFHEIKPIAIEDLKVTVGECYTIKKTKDELRQIRSEYRNRQRYYKGKI